MYTYQKSLTIFILLLLSSNISALNILAVTTYFPAHEGRFILNQIIGLIDAGHHVTIFAKHKGPKSYHPLIDEYNLWENVIIGLKPQNIIQYDVILCQFGYRGAECAKWLKRIAQEKRPYLVTCFRGADISKFVKENPNMYNLLFASGDLFLPVCEYFKNQLITLGCPKEKIKVLHSGIDCDAFSFAPKKLDPEKPIIITSVCRLVEKKGIEHVLDAIAKMIIEFPQIQYWIIGDGLLKEKLIQQAHSLGIAQQVTFWGRQPESAVVNILHQSHIFVLPSITAHDGDIEGIPNALKEAMACGVPVIATNHAGNSELIRNGMGILVPEKNIPELTSAIRQTIDTYNTDTITKQIEKARKQVVEKYDTKKIAQKTNVVLDLLCNKIYSYTPNN